VTSSLAVFETAIWVKSTHLMKSCLKTRKKGENMEIKKLLHKSPSKIVYRPTRNSLLRRAVLRLLTFPKRI